MYTANTRRDILRLPKRTRRKIMGEMVFVVGKQVGVFEKLKESVEDNG